MTRTFALTEQEIQEFQDLYRDAYGIELSMSDAHEVAEDLLSFMAVMVG